MDRNDPASDARMLIIRREEAMKVPKGRRMGRFEGWFIHPLNWGIVQTAGVFDDGEFLKVRTPILNDADDLYRQDLLKIASPDGGMADALDSKSSVL